MKGGGQAHGDAPPRVRGSSASPRTSWGRPVDQAAGDKMAQPSVERVVAFLQSGEITLQERLAVSHNGYTLELVDYKNAASSGQNQIVAPEEPESHHCELIRRGHYS